MQLTIFYTNAQGETLNLNTGSIRIVSMEGVSPTAVINTSSISGYDGAAYISSQMPMRNITILLELMGDVEANRQRIYDIFRVKQKGTLYYQTEKRNVKIECYTEKLPFSLTSRTTEMQISLLCPQPYFESLAEIQSYIAQIVPLWEFPFEISDETGFEFSEISQSLIANVPNNGEVDTGCVFAFYATGNCKNPKIENINTHEWIQVGLSGGSLELNMVAGDILKIDTRLGQKAITYIHNGVEQNYINYKVYGSKFLQLAVGDNEFRYSAEENERNLEITVYYTEKFGGV